MANTTLVMTLVAVVMLMVTNLAVSTGANSLHKRVERVEEKASDGNATIDPFNVIQAVAFSVASGVSISDEQTYIHYIANGDYVGYYQVDFGDGAQAVSMSIGGYPEVGTHGYIYLTLDSPDIAPFHILAVGNTYSKMFTVTEYLDYPVAAVGLHDLYFKFAFDDSSMGQFLTMEKFQFVK